MSGQRQSHPGGIDAAARQVEWHSRRLWQLQPVRDLLIIGSVVGLVYLGYRLSVVTVPLLLAMTLAYLFEPLVRRLTRWPWLSRQGVAAGIILATALVIVVPVVLGAGFAVIQGVSLAREVATNVRALERSFSNPGDQEALDAVPPGAWRSIRDRIVEVRKREKRLEQEGASPPADGSDPSGASPPDEHERSISEFGSWVLTRISENLGAIGQALGKGALGTGANAVRAGLATITSIGYLIFSVFLTAFFFFFFCTGFGRVLAFWESLIPERRKGRVLDLLAQMDAVISGFIRGRLMICGILMCYYTLAYWFIGVPAPLVLGPLVGVLGLIPYAAGIGVPVAMLLLWLNGEGAAWQAAWWWIIFAPIGVSMLSQLLDDYILSPVIQGKATNMDTPTILFASIAGGTLMGVYGLLLAIPAAACLKILLHEVVWPRFRDWAEGRTRDPLPIASSDRKA